MPHHAASIEITRLLIWNRPITMIGATIRRISGLVFILVFLTTDVFAQSASLSGVVTERGSSEPLEYVNVIVQGTTLGTSTGPGGHFEIKRLAPGNYTIAVKAIGFKTEERTVELQAGSHQEMAFSLAPARLNLPNVEVTGQSAALYRSAGSVALLSYEALRLSSPLGTEEVLRKIPGIHISTDDGNSNRANIGIRGTYPRRSERVLLLEDGVPIQPALYVAPSAYYNPPTERIDAIEVIKNASNARFGPNTVGGVINYITRRPPLDPAGTLRITGGEHGYLSAFAAYGGTTADQRFGGELQTLYTRGDGQRDNTSFDIYNVTGKALYRFNRQTTISFKGNFHQEDAYATYSALTPFMFAVDPRQNPFGDDFLATQRFAGDINLQSALSHNLVFTGTAYANRFVRDWWRENSSVVQANTLSHYADASSNAYVRVGTGTNRARLREFHVYGINPRLVFTTRTADIGHELEGGLSLHSETFFDVEIDTDRPDARPSNFAGASYTDLSDPHGRKRKNDELNATAIAGYVQYRFTIGDLSITPGIRLERYTQQRINKYDLSARQDTYDVAENTTVEILPGAGFTYNLPIATIFGGIQTAFVPLPTSAAFADLVDEAGVIVSDDLKSERALNMELGVRSAGHLPATFEVAVFNNEMSNMIAAGRNAGFQPIIDNLGQVRYQGLEAAGTLDLDRLAALPGGLSVDGALTLMRSEILQGLMDEAGNPTGVDIAGNQAPYAPELLYMLGLTVRPMVGLDVRASYSFVGEQFADFNNTVAETPQGDNGLLPSYGFLDATVRYTVQGTGLSVLVAGKNLTNEVYRGSRMHRASSGIFPGGFRQVNVGIEWNF
jgi:Fe(3+) dicitrate transport protein